MSKFLGGFTLQSSKNSFLNELLFFLTSCASKVKYYNFMQLIDHYEGMQINLMQCYLEQVFPFSYNIQKPF